MQPMTHLFGPLYWAGWRFRSPGVYLVARGRNYRILPLPKRDQIVDFKEHTITYRWRIRRDKDEELPS